MNTLVGSTVRRERLAVGHTEACEVQGYNRVALKTENENKRSQVKAKLQRVLG
jgi:hypothetical protein